MTSDHRQVLVAEISNLVQQEIAALLPQTDDKLAQAMRYSALSAGKRLRPFMLVTTADMFEVERHHSLRAAAAVEIVHSYSLIHDDLPAMDNDDYRRGMPSCHKQFDEATAILAGDSLLTLAFEILADPSTHEDGNIRCELIKILAQNIGSNGMAGGQIYDLIYEREILATYDQIIQMHWMKTARLFIASCTMGAVLGRASLKAQQHLSRYAELFGLAFQFVDDLEDLCENQFLESDKAVLSNNNIIQIIGEDQTKARIIEFVHEARQELLFFEEKGKILDSLATQLLPL